MRMHLRPCAWVILRIVHIGEEQVGKQGVVLQLATQHRLASLYLLVACSVDHVRCGGDDDGEGFPPRTHGGGEHALEVSTAPRAGIPRLRILVKDGE